MSARRKPGRAAPAQWGTTRQLASGRWQGLYRIDGRQITAPRTFATKAEALAWLAGERADRARGTWRDPEAGRVRLDDYARDWLAARPDLAARTADTYRRALEGWVLPRVAAPGSRGFELGSMDVADLTPATVRAWYAAVFDAARVRAADKHHRDTAAPPRGSATRRREHPARAWARGAGLKVPAAGRIGRDLLAAWERAGSPVAPAADVPAPSTPPGVTREWLARRWAKATGRDVHATGRLPRATVAAWEAAGSPIITPAGARPVVAPERAGRATAARAYATLRAVLTVAVRDGLLPSNPCQIPGAASADHRERGTASPAEVAQLAAHMPRQYSAAVWLAAWSGLRYGELFALSRRHVDVEARTVRVERALINVPGQPVTFGTPKTRKSARTVRIPATVAQLLVEHLADHVADDPDALVFALPDGRPVPNVRVSAWFRKARAVIEREDLTWHDLRHTGAMFAYRAGASVPAVQARLGHTTMRAAMIYAHAADDSDAVLADALEPYAAAAANPPRLRAV